MAAEFPYHLAAKENRDGGRNKNDERKEKRAEKKYIEEKRKMRKMGKGQKTKNGSEVKL